MPEGTSKNVVVNGQSVAVTESPSGRSVRLVHDGTNVLSLSESSGVTATKHHLFFGTYTECIGEIQGKGLVGFKPFVAKVLEDKIRSARFDKRHIDLVYANLMAELTDSAEVLSNIEAAIAIVKARLEKS